MAFTRRALPLVAVALFTWSAVPGAEVGQVAGGTHGHRELRVTRVERAPTLDGVLDEAEWETADVADGFMQRETRTPLPATEATEVRVLTDGRNLYFGVHCFDREPRAILARDMARGTRLSNDDAFSILLDTFHDHRSAFTFRVNPLGTQQDGTIDAAGTPNYDWDERWESAARIHEKGWSAEIKIPMKALRFAPSEERRVLGIDFRRIIRRKNEVTAWNNFNRNTRFFLPSQAGHLTGLDHVGGRLRVRVKPYVNARLRQRGGAAEPVRFLRDVGLEDVKVPINSGLTLDFTVNPDFAQTEVDDEVINFDRVPTFFPEKREFFQEGAGIFNVAVDGRAARMYHSRRIGLSDDGQTVPILGGAKVSGRFADRFTLGLLNMQTGDTPEQPGSNFSVVRLQRDVLARSSMGLFATNRQGRNGTYNRVAGWDQNLLLFQHLNITGLFARSWTSGLAGAPKKMWAAGWSWTDDLLTAGFDYYMLDEEFRADVGFLSRVGVRKFAPHLQISPRPRSGPIRQYRWGVRLDQFRRLDGSGLETEIYRMSAPDLLFQDGSGFRFAPARTTEVLRRPLRLAAGLTVPPGEYAWWSFPVTYDLNPARRFTGTFEYRIERDYFGRGGGRQTWGARPALRFNANVSTELGYTLNRIHLPGGAPVNVHVMNSRLNVAFSRQWATSTLVQYSSARELIGMNFRLRYSYRAGDDVFLVINSFRAGSGDLLQVDRSVTVKFTRGFDF